MTHAAASATGHRKVPRAPAGSKSGVNGRNGTAKKPGPGVAAMLESVIGCKWSMSVLAAIRSGVHRPGAMERACPGISAKVLNERLRKLTRFGVVRRKVYPEVPPRVEYHFTTFGTEFLALIDAVERLQRKHQGE